MLTRGISPCNAARTDVIDSGKNTIMPIRMPESATGAPTRSSPSSRRVAMSWESSTMGRTVTISTAIRSNTSVRWSAMIWVMLRRLYSAALSGWSGPVEKLGSISRKSSTCEPICRYRKKAYRAKVSTMMGIVWPDV